MKKILLSLLLPAFALSLTTSCDNDNDSNPTLDVSHAADGFVLNVPANAANNTYDLTVAEKLWLTTSQPNYGGIPYMTRYYVQVSNEASFENYRELGTSFTTAKFGVDAYEMNQAIVEMFQEANPDTDYPNTPAPVWVRLRAIIDGYDFGESFSNIIELPSVLATYQAPKAELPTELFIVGSSIQTPWTSWKATAPVWSQEGKFYTMAYFPAGGQFKWGLFANDWRGYDRIKTYDDQAGAGVHEAASDGNIQIDNAGWYALLFEAEVVGNSIQYTLHIYPGKAYVIGNACGGSWTDGDSAWEMTAPADNTGQWVSPAFTSNGELRAYIKVPGISWWCTEFTVVNGTLDWRVTNIVDNWTEVDDDHSVQLSPGQQLFVDFDNNTGEVK